MMPTGGTLSYKDYNVSCFRDMIANLVGILAGILVVFYCHLRIRIHYTKTWSYTKPEVHNIKQCLQRRTEPQPQATCTKNLAKFGDTVFELASGRHIQTNTQTDILIITLRNRPWQSN